MRTYDDRATTIECGPLTLRCTRQDGEHVLALYGELDLAGVEALEDELRHIEQARARRVIIDLSGLEYMDSTGLRCLLGFASRASRNGARPGFLRGQPAVQRVFDITGTGNRLDFLD